MLQTEYEYTGPLRPAVVSPQMTVPDHIEKPDYAESGRAVSSARWVAATALTRVSPGIPHSEERDRNTRATVTDKQGIAAMRDVCKVGARNVSLRLVWRLVDGAPSLLAQFAAEILQMCGSMCQPGVTGDQIDRAVFAAAVEGDGRAARQRTSRGLTRFFFLQPTRARSITASSRNRCASRPTS